MVVIIKDLKSLLGRIEKMSSVTYIEHIATTYAELRSAVAEAKSGGGTLPVTARTLENIIRLSTAHAKMKLRNQVLKSDVESAIKVLNFAIYHTQLTEMDQREQGREQEIDKKRRADGDSANGRHDGDHPDGSGNRGRARRQKKDSRDERNGGSETQPTIPEETTKDTDIDSTTAPTMMGISSEREARMNNAFSEYMMVNHEETITMDEVARVINRGNTHDPYSPAEISRQRRIAGCCS